MLLRLNALKNKNDNYRGIFNCVVCNLQDISYLPYTPEQLEKLLALTIHHQLPLLQKIRCPECERYMLLQRVLNEDGKEVLNTWQWIEKELRRIHLHC